MARTTIRELALLARSIDDALGLPEGTHDLDIAYGSPRLVCNGGSHDVSPRLPAGQLLDWMRAYKAGIYAGRAALIGEVRRHPVAAFDNYGTLRP